MTFNLRYYQEEAVDSLFHYFGEKGGNPLAILPTGTGKSIVIADFCQCAINMHPQTRIIVATHSKELVKQNHEKFIKMAPEIDTGLYSAGLRKKQYKGKQVIFAGIQSIFRKAYDIQQCDLLIVDEAHTIPETGDGMWRKFIADMLVINPSMKVIGLTATDYRMKSGSLIHDDGLFTDVAYEYPILKALSDGFICEPIPKPMKTVLDISGVGKRGGEFIPGQLEEAINVDHKTQAAIQEVLEWGVDRKSWLGFAAGNKHAHAITAELRRHGVITEVLTEKTPAAERDRIIQDFKDGKIRCLINNMILTTGFDAPDVDMIFCLRPTGSPGLWVQILGRGMRLPVWNVLKKNCLVLDFARNADRHGPLDKIRPTNKGQSSGNGDAPVRVCPKCHCTCFAGSKVCPDCQYEFPEGELKIHTNAATDALLSTQQKPVWHDVMAVSYTRHEKIGKKPSMRVWYTTGEAKRFSDWVFFEHEGRPRIKAVSWHHRHSTTQTDCPTKIEDALKGDYKQPKRIQVEKEGKYFKVVGCEF